MKKSLAKKITLSILAGAVLMSSSVAWARAASGGGDYNWIYSSNSEYAVVFLRHPVNNEIGNKMSSVIEDWGDKGVTKESLESASFLGSVTEYTNASGGIVTLDEDIAVDSLVGGYACDDNLINSEGQSLSIEDGVAESNTVNISNGTVKYSVYGGWGSTATNNTVNISGGTFYGGIVGGFALSDAATNNTVNISGTANLENAALLGGATKQQMFRAAKPGTVVVGSYGGADTPNTLNIGWDSEKAAAWTGANAGKVKSIAGFDVINIYGVQWDEVNPHITVDDIELKDTKINAYVSGEQTDVSSKKMNLIDATTITMANGATNYLHNDSKVTLYDGVASIYTGVVEVDETNKDVVIKLETKSSDSTGSGGDQGTSGDNTSGDNTGDDNTGGDNTGGDNTGDDNTGGDNTGGDNTGGDNTGEGTLQPSRNNQVLVLGESRAAAVAFTNQGSELIELGLNALARDNSKDTKVFAAVYGNHSEYETGSHVNVNGWSGIVGIGKTNANGLTVGAFFENGEGNYSTHNDYNAQYIRGDGEANYNGGGLLVRKDNANGVYAEASLRAGNLQNELRNAVRNGQDLTGYDVDTFYYGAHIGIGKVIPRGADGDSLDVYGKFIYTHHDGETFDVGGTPTKFDSVESERLRLGFRLNEVQTNKLNMYYGAAWEYEFNGDAHDKIASFDLETPSLEGSTVIGEIGAHYKASDKWSFDLNGRAYTGQREGFSGSVQANYSF